MATKKKLLQAAGGAGSYWISLLGGTANDYGRSIAIDSSDNIVIFGYTLSDGAGSEDLLVVKYDSSGTFLWGKTLGGTGRDFGYGVAIDSSDNIVVVGYTDSDGAGASDLLVAKYSSTGTFLWSRTLGGTTNDFGFSAAIDSSDNIVIVGYTNSDGAGSYDLLAAKYSSSGTLLWSRTLGGTASEIGYGVAIDSSGDIVAVGYAESDGAGSRDILVAKYSSTGTFIWSRTLGGTGNDYALGVDIDSSDNIVVVGYTTSDGAGGNDVLVAKYSSNGTLLWDKTLGAIANDYGRALVIDSSDNIIIAGQTDQNNTGNFDLLVAKYSSSGTFLWGKTLGGVGFELAYSVAIDSSGNIVVTGYTSSDGAGNQDFLVAKLPPDGTGDGTYGNLVYQDAVLTDAVAVLTDATAILTSAVAVLTSDVAVLTDEAAVLTEEFFEITP